MKKLVPFFVLGTIASANAQVVIDQADFAEIGDVITFGDDADISDNAVPFNPGSGPFDCSTLETDDLFEVGFYDPSTVQGGSEFPLSNIAVDQVGGIYAFATVASGSVDIIGLGGDFGTQLGLTSPLVLALHAQDPWTLFEFPASVNSPILMDTAQFEGQFLSDGLIPPDISGFWNPDSVQIKRVIYYEADVVADGQLTDPLGGTHDVIQMDVVETNFDTIYGWTPSNGWELLSPALYGFIGFSPMSTVYRTRYVSKSLGYYVVDVTTEANGTPLSATFVSDPSECCTGVEEIVAAGQNVLYPNPTNGSIRVRTGGDIYQLNIMDMSGKLLQTARLTVDGQTVELNGLANGLYIYEMVDESGKIAHTGRLSCIH